MDADRLYAVLELVPGASAEDVKAAYIDLVKVWHPDRFHGESSRLREKAERKLKEINEAYEKLRRSAQPGQAEESPGAAKVLVDLFAACFGDRWGFVNREGKLVIPAVFDTAEQFSEGLACVSEVGRYGYIDLNGQYVIHPQYSRARTFSEGRAAVVFSTKWGFIDRHDRYAVHPNYEDCGDFSESFAAVQWRGRWGYIDTEGRFAVKPRFHEAHKFADGFAAVRLGDRWGKVTRAGEAYFAGKPLELV